MKKAFRYANRRSIAHACAYPNAARPGYRTAQMKNALVSAATGMGTVVILLLLAMG